MSDADKIRHFAAVVRAERSISAAAKVALTSYLAALQAAWLSGQGSPDLSRVEQEQWDESAEVILAVLASLWMARWKASGAPLAAAEGPRNAYLSHTRQFLATVPGHIHDHVNTKLDAAVREGATVSQLRGMVRRELNLSEWIGKAEQIGQGNGVIAYNDGITAGYNYRHAAHGLQVTKSWMATLDTRVRETHAAAYADEANQNIPVDEFFHVGGFTCQHPGDISLPVWESANCRCVAIFEVEGAVVAAADGNLSINEGVLMSDVTITVGAGESAPAAEELALPNGWRGPIAGLDVETGDERWLATPPGGVRTREYPLTLTFKHVGEDDIPIGNVLRVWMGEDDLLWGEGYFDLNNEEGRKYAGMLRDGIINTVSIHPDQVSGAYRIVGPDGKLIDGDAEDYVSCGADGYCNLLEGYRAITVFEDWRLAGLAMVSVPAYTEARIEPLFDYTGPVAQESDAIVASFQRHEYRAESFEAPKFTEWTPFTVDAEKGIFYGHVASFTATCHLDFPGMCVQVPPAVDAYERFHQHSVLTADGFLTVGALTFGEGHESRGGLQASKRHYANVGTISGYARAGEDQFGPWVVGEFTPGSDEKTLNVIASAPLSGHWEPDPDLGGELVLIAVHSVVTPGFRNRHLVASFDPLTEKHNLVVTTTPARAIVREPSFGQEQIDAIAAAVEARMHDRASKPAKVAELAAKIGVDGHKAARVADLLSQIQA